MKAQSLAGCCKGPDPAKLTPHRPGSLTIDENTLGEAGSDNDLDRHRPPDLTVELDDGPAGSPLANGRDERRGRPQAYELAPTSTGEASPAPFCAEGSSRAETI